MTHHSVHICEPIYVPCHTRDLHTQVAHAHETLALDACIQQGNLDKRKLALWQRLGVLQDDRDGFIRVEHAEGEVGRRWFIEVTIVVRDA